MVGSKHIDRHVGGIFFPVALVKVIGDVGSKISQIPVRLYNHPVFVVAVLGGSKPGSAVLFVDVALLAQNVYRPLGRTAVMKALLMEPNVKIRSEIVKGVLDFVKHHGDGPFPKFLQLAAFPFNLGKGENIDSILLSLFYDFGSDFSNISSLVAIFGSGLPICPGHKRLCKPVYLLSVIIEVVLPYYLRSIGGQNSREGVSYSSPAGSPYMYRTGRVCRNIFKIYSDAFEVIVSTEFPLFI